MNKHCFGLRAATATVSLVRSSIRRTVDILVYASPQIHQAKVTTRPTDVQVLGYYAGQLEFWLKRQIP